MQISYYILIPSLFLKFFFNSNTYTQSLLNFHLSSFTWTFLITSFDLLNLHLYGRSMKTLDVLPYLSISLISFTVSIMHPSLALLSLMVISSNLFLSMIACETKSYHYCRQLLNIDKSLIAFSMLITLRYGLSGLIIAACQILFMMKILMKRKNGGLSKDSIDL
jgi:hypothetical protein